MADKGGVDQPRHNPTNIEGGKITRGAALRRIFSAAAMFGLTGGIAGSEWRRKNQPSKHPETPSPQITTAVIPL